MGEVVVDLRDSQIRNVEDALLVMREAKTKFPRIDSIILSPTQSLAIARTDHALVQASIRLSIVTGVPVRKLEWYLEKLDTTKVVIE